MGLDDVDFSNSIPQHLGREDGDFENMCEGVNQEDPELSAHWQFSCASSHLPVFFLNPETTQLLIATRRGCLQKSILCNSHLTCTV